MENGITRREIALKTGCTRQYIDLIMGKKRRPSPDLAKQLEEITKIERLAWLYPDEYPNRMIQSSSNGSESLEG